QARDLRVLVVEAVCVAALHDVDLVDRKFSPHDREVDFFRTETTREVVGHNIRQVTALKVHVNEERLARDAVDPFDRLVHRVAIVDAAGAVCFLYPLREPSVAIWRVSGAGESPRVEEAIEAAQPMEIDHAAPTLVLRGEDRGLV